jgi:hypothetical protein
MQFETEEAELASLSALRKMREISPCSESPSARSLYISAMQYSRLALLELPVPSFTEYTWRHQTASQIRWRG